MDCSSAYLSQYMAMKTTRISKQWSKHNVPLDVWSEIISRLPVKSLLRFRSVSKSWRMLIDDPDFCYLHLNRFKNNSDETHLLFVQGYVNYCFTRCSETFKTSRRLGSLGSWDRKTKSNISTAIPGCVGRWYVWSSLDGLILLKTKDHASEGALMLWNPSIRISRCLPPSLVEVSSVDIKNVELGLGFDPVIKDYKVVRVYFQNSVHAVSVYTVGTNSWKTIEYRQRGSSNGSWPAYVLDSVYFRGCLYFISGSKELVSFNLSSEVFTFANLPPYDDQLPYANSSDKLAFVDGGCSLAVVRFSFLGGCIWALEYSTSDAILLCWTKRFTFSRGFRTFYYLTRSGDLLLPSDESYQVTAYNVENQEEKLLPKASCSKITNQVRIYKESLLLLK